MPVSVLNGTSAARKSCCSCAVHSPQTVTEPPILLLVEPLELAGGVVLVEPHAVAIPRTPAVTTASFPRVLTCVIRSPLRRGEPRGPALLTNHRVVTYVLHLYSKRNRLSCVSPYRGMPVVRAAMHRKTGSRQIPLLPSTVHRSSISGQPC